MTAEYKDIIKLVGDEYRRLEIANARLPKVGYLRIDQIIGNRKTNPPTPGLLPVGRSTWLAGVKSGRFPKPVKGLGKRISAWRATEILALIQALDNECLEGSTK